MLWYFLICIPRSGPKTFIMSFLFASSHLPETRARRPDHFEEDDDEDSMSPPPRAGMVRAFSHLPAKEETVNRTGPLSQRSAQTLGHPFQRTETQDTRTTQADGISAAKASGVFDAVRQQYNSSGSPHYMDEDGNLRPRQESSPLAGAGTPPRPAPRASADTSPWHQPPITHQDLHSQDSENDTGFGSHSSFAGRPDLHDLVYRTHGGEPPLKPGFNDLVYRFNGSPEEAKKRTRSLFQKVADLHGASQQMAVSASDLAQNGSEQPGPGPVHPLDSKVPPQQPSPQAPAPGAAKVSPKSPGPSVADPVAKLKEHAAKSRNPIFIRDYYDEKTPLEEKLLLKQLILSLKAPAGEKLPLPIANLQHWLNIEGRPDAENEGPLEIPFESLSKFGVMKDGGEKLLKYFSTHPDKALEQKNMFDWLRSHPDTAGTGGSIPDTYWDTLVSGKDPGIAGYFGYARPGNEEFFYGLGDATLTANSSGIKGSVDKNNAARAEGHIVYTLKDRYDWNKNQGVTIPLTMEMIQKYLPKGVPLITPKNKSIQINDSFFHDLEKRGHGRSFDVQSKSPPLRYEFVQPKPGQPPMHRLIPAPSTGHLQFEGSGLLP